MRLWLVLLVLLAGCQAQDPDAQWRAEWVRVLVEIEARELARELHH